MATENVVRTIMKYLLGMAFLFCLGQDSLCGQKIVVDDADVARIDAARMDIQTQEHVGQPVLVSLSLTFRYLDYDGYKELIKLDNKIIPFLIRDLIRSENSHILYGKGHYQPPPKDDKEWLQEARQEQRELEGGTTPRFICLIALANTSFGKASHRTGHDGIDEVYLWLKWWEENKDRYALTFKDSQNFDVGDLDQGKYWPHLSCRMTDGLLNVRAVHAKLKNIVENVAAEAGIKAVVGEIGSGPEVEFFSHHDFIVDYRQMTFDEFAYAITTQVASGRPLTLRKEGDTYYFGTGGPVPGMWMTGLSSNELICEIKMDRTVFKSGDPMPLGISLRYSAGYFDKEAAGIEVIAGAPAEAYPVFVIQVINEDGKLLPRKQAAKANSRDLKTLKLGGASGAKQYMGEVDLSRLFNWVEPGDYTVIVKYNVGQDLKAGTRVWRGQAASSAVFVKIVK